jgi:hypothetical protein
MPLDEKQRSIAMVQIVTGLLARTPGGRQDSKTLAREARELLQAIENEAALPAQVHDSPRARQ